MTTYLNKLHSGSYDPMYLYNDVSVALEWALKDKRIINNKFLAKELSLYLKIVSGFKVPYRLESIKEEELVIAELIKEKSYKIIKDFLS